jgi:hypothetical protein
MSGGDSFRRGFHKQENERLKRRIKEQNERLEIVEEDISRNNLIIGTRSSRSKKRRPVRNKRKKESLKNIGADSMQILG